MLGTDNLMSARKCLLSITMLGVIVRIIVALAMMIVLIVGVTMPLMASIAIVVVPTLLVARHDQRRKSIGFQIPC